MSQIFVCPLSRLDETLETSGAKWVIGLAGPGKEIPCPTVARSRFLQLTFNDISEERDGLIAPTRNHIDQILTFVDRWDRKSPLLIFCWMGISRSTAAALLAACRIRPDVSTEKLTSLLRELSPMATPNPLIIKHGDEALGHDGGLVASVNSIGRGADAFEGAPFQFNLTGL